MPGEPGLEHRIRSLVRWNALAMVVQANRESAELGGHIASFASAATLYDVGMNHFFRGARGDHSGDLVYIQGHSSPGIYARAYLEGRLSEEQLRNFRREVDGPRTLVVSAPVADAGVLAVPDRLDGTRPDHGDLPGALPPLPGEPRDRARRRSQGLGVHGRRRDGRARVARRHRPRRAREARQPDLRGELQPAAPRRTRARQRQDHPGARRHLPRRRLERDQGDLGIALGSAAREGQEAACSSSA